MKKLTAVLALASLLAFSATALADEGHSGHFTIPEGFREQTPAESHGGLPNHEDMPNMTPEEHQNMPSEPSNEGHGHDGLPVAETPPNYKVLGVFGTINAGFILFGIWNKWLRRKETRVCQAR